MASTAAPRKALDAAEARDRTRAAARPLPEEIVPLERALGRALRRPIVARHPLPPFRNSAMDGFAVRVRDLERASPGEPADLAVSGVMPAGRVAGELPPGAAVRIMTGAEVPRGADAIVPLEEADAAPEGRARFRAPVASGAHIREAGLDLAHGAVALPAGRELSAHDLALLAALGVGRVPVGPRPRVAVLSTGNELLDPNGPLEPGRIYDSNATLLRSLAEESGAGAVTTERLADDPRVVSRAIARAILEAEVVITVGGVSVGDFDPVAQGLEALPWIELWRVAMRPGQHQAFGAVDGRLFFGLPGNPASVAVLFEVLVRPALRRLQGFETLDAPRFEVRAGERIASRAGRADFARVTLAWREGAWWAHLAGAQVSGHLTPQARAHALLEVPPERDALEPGEIAVASLLRWPA